MFGTTEVNCKIWKQVKSSCGTLRRIKLLFTLFVSDSERIVFVNEAINWHEQSVQPPKVIENKVPLAGFEFLSHLWDGSWMEWRAGVVGRLSMKVKSLKSKWNTPSWGHLQRGRWRLHLVGGKMVFWDTVGVSHSRVILVEAPDAIHFIVDAAGDVLYVLHMGPGRNTYIHTHPLETSRRDRLYTKQCVLLMVWPSLCTIIFFHIYLQTGKHCSVMSQNPVVP